MQTLSLAPLRKHFCVSGRQKPRLEILVATLALSFGAIAIAAPRSSKAPTKGSKPQTVKRPLAPKVALPAPPKLSFSILHRFEAKDGSDLSCVRRDGEWVYGSAAFGGQNTSGTLWKVRSDGSQFQVLHTFGMQMGGTTATTNDDGATPRSLIVGSDGFLYGICSSGGPIGHGTIWRIKTDGEGFQILHSFSAPDKDDHNADGTYLMRSLAFLPDGTLLGGCGQGGPQGWGLLWTIEKDGKNFRVLKDFSAAPTATKEQTRALLRSQGANPIAFTVSKNGITGTTRNGGTKLGGTVWSCALDGSNFRVLHSFEAEFAEPDLHNHDGLEASAVIEHGGVFWGVCSSGGNDDKGIDGGGTLWKIGETGNDFRLLQIFSLNESASNYNYGSSPIDALYVSPSGFAYGITRHGGKNGEEYVGNGTCFRVGANGTGFQVVYAFDTLPYDVTQPLDHPVSMLAFSEDGRLYGTVVEAQDSPQRTETLFVSAPLP